MRITKLGHSCVRLERDGATLVIDPGTFSEPDAAAGADAIAITHEHPDHFDPDRLYAAATDNPELEIYAHPSVAARLSELTERGVRVHEVVHGDTPRMAGFDVHVYGERHAVIHPDIPVVANVGFRIEAPGGALFHPGDALTVPEDPVALLLLPLHAPWMKVGELIDYAREVAPQRAVAIHDGLLNEVGAGVYAKNLALTEVAGGNYERLTPGESREL
ncbi:L-ascorbate metabolism protein UlaG, beta-lactamase superfamily [Marinactinospora thermotolerans DSM 45154]|uniref:L-ascorbate metabolism protein UlaG, beta-lactamase superfamily n=1 Tax=Marinactinospora thermotolerans DSM 45154 TaxID=1122192 RepID=A0A1T4S822_9ACTN|nr:MBL fold metallo-hydrolase [Marinactinospora thermotolerans]SKA24307.1 L-ascorbate metabolism protein UlaG, beta-lactamase superfamily [Marinactinospora thermotolerans DSM 45154]